MTRTLFTRAFWADAADRALRTAAQAVLLAIGGDRVFDVLTADLSVLIGAAGGGALISILTSIVASARTGTISPASLVKEG